MNQHGEMSGLQMGKSNFLQPLGKCRSVLIIRIEETFGPWLKETLDSMLPLLPPPSPNFTPVPTTSLPAPIFDLDFSAPNLSKLSLADLPNGQDYTKAPSRVVDESHGAASSDLKPDDWSWARLTRNNRVTKDGWWQDVREIEFEIEYQNL